MKYRKLLMGLSITVLLFIGLIIIIMNSDAGPPTIMQQLSAMKKDYPIETVDSNLRCKEIWDDDRLIERECRKFDQ